MSNENKPLVAVVGATSKQGRSVASTLTWEGFLRCTGWQGQTVGFGAAP